mmetsp:Transcript_37654/g.90919  ORF Transcript_37654/g.90919 Transcript_37654/m.90919 type:complete len:292 (-) Transcript_37654:644-1519(-)
MLPLRLSRASTLLCRSDALRSWNSASLACCRSRASLTLLMAATLPALAASATSLVRSSTASFFCSLALTLLVRSFSKRSAACISFSARISARIRASADASSSSASSSGSSSSTRLCSICALLYSRRARYSTSASRSRFCCSTSLRFSRAAILAFIMRILSLLRNWSCSKRLCASPRIWEAFVSISSIYPFMTLTFSSASASTTPLSVTSCFLSRMNCSAALRSMVACSSCLCLYPLTAPPTTLLLATSSRVRGVAVPWGSSLTSPCRISAHSSSSASLAASSSSALSCAWS